MSKKIFVRAEEGEPPGISVVYYDTEGNKTIRYHDLDMERTVKSLNNEEYEKLLKAMETHEGWIEGYEEFKVVEKITGIRMNKKRVISEYLVRGMKDERWLLKDAAIAMAEDGCLHAIVVHTKNGSYLRPEHGSKSFKELLC